MRIEENILSGNKLIAEFMGCYGSEVYWGNEPCWVYGFKNTHISERWREAEFVDQTPYHTSWVWLMGAVDEIEKMGYVVRICENCCDIYTKGIGVHAEYYYASIEKNKIDATRKAIIQFIEWLNKEQETTTQTQ